MSKQENWRVKQMPGKFEGNVDEELAERLYDATLEGGCDEEIGSVHELGWYGRFIDRVGQYYYILFEDSDGFFEYFQFDSLVELNQAWAEVEGQYIDFIEMDIEA